MITIGTSFELDFKVMMGRAERMEGTEGLYLMGWACMNWIGLDALELGA